MKDAPAGGRCMRAARAASRGHPPGRLPAGARRGRAAAAGGRLSPRVWPGGLRSGGRVDPLFSPAAFVGSCGLMDAGGAAWQYGVRAEARRTHLPRWTESAGQAVALCKAVSEEVGRCCINCVYWPQFLWLSIAWLLHLLLRHWHAAVHHRRGRAWRRRPLV